MSGLTTLIVADDLTGALDSVAPFASLGLDCVVATSPDCLSKAIALGPEVLSINLGTRELGAEAARTIAGTTALAMQRHVSLGTIWIKKIDSRMKGEIEAEVASVLEVTGLERVLLCPAVPELGRMVVAGRLEGAGVMQPIPVHLQLPKGVEVSIPDALSDADLDGLVRACEAGTLFVGARGLAAAVARRLHPGQARGAVPMPAGPVGFCIGSRDLITLAQVDALRAVGLHYVAAPDGQVPDRTKGGDVLVQATPGTGASAEQAAANLAEGVLKHLKNLATLVVSGGETAAAVLRAAGIGVVRVRGDVAPGMPLCQPVDAPGFPAVVTKSGGFGPPDTLLQLWQAAHSKEGQPCH
jgi:D-threonate/D-erythronate kinase